MNFLLEDYLRQYPIKPDKFDFNLELKKQNWSSQILELFLERTQLFYDDLDSNPQKVCLIDAPYKIHQSHKIRQLESSPPSWYLILHHKHGSVIRTKNKITNKFRNNWTSNYRRAYALNSFKRITKNKDLNGTKSSYDRINRELIFLDLTNKNLSYFGFDLDFSIFISKQQNQIQSKIPF